jgi:hypothetical protein
MRRAWGHSRVSASLIGATECARAWMSAIRVIGDAQIPFDDGFAKASRVSALSG